MWKHGNPSFVTFVTAKSHITGMDATIITKPEFNFGIPGIKRQKNIIHDS